MAESRACTTIATGVLLMSLLLAVAVSAGQDVSAGELTTTTPNDHTKKMKTTPIPLTLKRLAVAVSAGQDVSAGELTTTTPNDHTKKMKTTPIPLTLKRRREPLSDLTKRYDKHVSPTTEKYGPPLEVVTSRRRVAKEVHKRKGFVGKPHKQTSHRVKSGRVDKVDLLASMKMKSKVHHRKIRGDLEKLMGRHVHAISKTKTNSPPMKDTPAARHVVKVKNNKKRIVVKPSESKKRRKRLPSHALARRVHKVKTTNPFANNKTITKKSKPHKKSLQVFQRAFVAETKKHGHGTSKGASFDERPLRKPKLTPKTTNHPFAKKKSKPKKLVGHNIKRRDVLSASSNRSFSEYMEDQKEIGDLETELLRELESYYNSPREKRSSETGGRNANEFTSKKERMKMSGDEHGKNLANGMIKVRSKTNEVKKIVMAIVEKQCLGDVYVNMTEILPPVHDGDDFELDEPFHLRAKRSVGSLESPENFTLAWQDDDVTKIDDENEGGITICLCIPTPTFALGLICMSVVLSVCFLMLWSRDNQPEKLYALAYIVACVVYVMLALLYLGSRYT